MNKQTLKYSVLASLPVMAGYIVLGIGFGILLAGKGYDFLWALLMSLTIYAGSMQYVGVELLAGGASLISTALMTVMVNARHLFYGISMVENYKETGKVKPYLMFALTDETYSLVCAAKLPEEVDRKQYYFLVSAMNQCYWILGSLLGALIGNGLSFNTKGIEFSMTALFVVIFVKQWESTKNHMPAFIGLGISLLCLLVFGADNFLIPAMLGITTGLFILRRLTAGKADCQGTDISYVQEGEENND